MTKFAFPLALFGLASASITELNQMLGNATSNSPQMRTFGIVGTNLLSDYLNYGCWCTLDQVPRGKGQPVNDIDRLCKVLQQEGNRVKILE